MLCEKIIGSLAEIDVQDRKIEKVDIEWHDAFKKIHRLKSSDGEEVGLRLDDSVLTRGLREGDILYEDAARILAVHILPCEAICAQVAEDHPTQIAKLCYEVGNTHTTMFRGEDEYTFYIPYYESMMEKLNKIHGVSVKKVCMQFDFDKALSSSVNNHHH